MCRLARDASRARIRALTVLSPAAPRSVLRSARADAARAERSTGSGAVRGAMVKAWVSPCTRSHPIQKLARVPKKL